MGFLVPRRIAILVEIEKKKLLNTLTFPNSLYLAAGKIIKVWCLAVCCVVLFLSRSCSHVLPSVTVNPLQLSHFPVVLSFFLAGNLA